MPVLNLLRDASGKATYIRQPSAKLYSCVLAKDSVQALTVPSDFPRYEVLFSFVPGTSVWIAINQNAAYPTAGTFALGTAELNPVAYVLNAGDSISFITADTSDFVGVCMYGSI